ncbi:Hypothetical protein R9X50_00042700 [Acrodontium crateriforme]|uniref:Mitochondrial glyco protein n=1 Tax=Acrodontium crateriforme TaxID=150365 RepID=A0AAQ3LXT5_9PEZI|nr:Hypothetical protein R9X50_00042700 [Acrodontium crateriforme]
MLSLRTFARAVPRSAARITTKTNASSLLRPAVRSAVRQQSATLPRCFSTTFPRFDAAAQELAAKLDSEIAIETAEDVSHRESNSDIDAFLQQNSEWTLHDVEGEQEVLLSRKYDDEVVTVGFSIADFNTPLFDEEADDALMDEGEELDATTTNGRDGDRKASANDEYSEDELLDDEDQPAYPAAVNVLIQRAGKGALRMNLVAESGSLAIQSVTHLPATAAEASPAELLRETSETLYAGPPFQQLDEEVQSLLEAYLDARGINTALAVFVPSYIDVKEQKEYLAWLSRVKNFVQ